LYFIVIFWFLHLRRSAPLVPEGRQGHSGGFPSVLSQLKNYTQTGKLRGVKQLARQGHDALHQVAFDDVAADVAFARLVGRERAVGQDEAGRPGGRQVPAKLGAVLGLLKDGGRG
jgi:hypothetical protein